MRLYLDDVRPTPPGFDLRAYDAAEAIKFILDGGITHISFDHDLGDGPTGYAVAAQIELLAYENQLPKLTWEIHSANPVGRDNIRAAMEKADIYWIAHNIKTKD